MTGQAMVCVVVLLQKSDDYVMPQLCATQSKLSQSKIHGVAFPQANREQLQKLWKGLSRQSIYSSLDL